jgi:ABC-2 type transport system ATP-binding protein
LISSHLLHLLEELCSHVLILKQGRKIADGTIDEVTRQFSGQQTDVSLEEIFFRATGEETKPVTAAVPPPLPQ